MVGFAGWRCLLSLVLVVSSVPHLRASWPPVYDFPGIYGGEPVKMPALHAMTATGNYSIFLWALNVTKVHHHMVEMFQHYQYTILAPTDDAFRSLPKWQRDKLFKSPLLVNVILQHYLRTMPPMDYAALKSLPASTTLQEEACNCTGAESLLKTTASGAEPVSFSNGNGANTATIVQPDVWLANVSVQGIDAVLLPKQDSCVKLPWDPWAPSPPPPSPSPLPPPTPKASPQLPATPQAPKPPTATPPAVKPPTVKPPTKVAANTTAGAPANTPLQKLPSAPQGKTKNPTKKPAKTPATKKPAKKTGSKPKAAKGKKKAGAPKKAAEKAPVRKAGVKVQPRGQAV